MIEHTPANPATITFQRRSLWLAAGAAVAAVALVATALALHRAPQAAPMSQPASMIEGPAPDDGTPPPPPAPPEARLMTQAPRPAPAAPAKPVAPAVCADCGTVESVQAVRQEGQASGVGAVAGGLIGGVLGHQVGGGNGRKAMTVVGAVGGGLAGHEIEKRRNASTVYRVTVRKDDGTRVTLNRTESWRVGARVSVDGGTLRSL